jgi:hypothetical protein
MIQKKIKERVVAILPGRGSRCNRPGHGGRRKRRGSGSGRKQQEVLYSSVKMPSAVSWVSIRFANCKFWN